MRLGIKETKRLKTCLVTGQRPTPSRCLATVHPSEEGIDNAPPPNSRICYRTLFNEAPKAPLLDRLVPSVAEGTGVRRTGWWIAKLT
jgi:hypothetical protein